MKINQRFINILVEKKISKIGEIILEMGFLAIEHERIYNIAPHYHILEEIFFTVDYLEKNGLIKLARAPGPKINLDLSDLIDTKKKYYFERIKHLEKLLDYYWNLEAHINFGLYRFIDNGYKTDEELEKEKNRSAPLVAAGLSALATVILTKIVDIAWNIYSCQR